jgi:hypothetical protein
MQIADRCYVDAKRQMEVEGAARRVVFGVLVYAEVLNDSERV